MAEEKKNAAAQAIAGSIAALEKMEDAALKKVEGAALKKVSFNFGGGSKVTQQVEVEGYEPFEITFETPRSSATVEIIAQKSDGMSQGDIVFNFIDRYLQNWTLESPATMEGLRAIADPEIVFAIFNKIRETGAAKAKN